MPSIVYDDFPEARLIIMWGVNPSASGIHLVPYVREAQRRGATLVVVDPRTTPLAKQADIHLAVRPGTDLPVALAIHRHLFENGHADSAFLAEHTHNADRLRRKRRPGRFERAAAEAGILPEHLHASPSSTPPRHRRSFAAAGGRNAIATAASSSLAILALPAVGGSSVCAAAATR
jgi:anaerobic selenocysteine-containing dehydrogenase